MPCLKAKTILECKIVSLVLRGLPVPRRTSAPRDRQKSGVECLSRFEIIRQAPLSKSLLVRTAVTCRT